MGIMRERMERGGLYIADDPELNEANLRTQRRLDRYNLPGFADDRAAGDELLRELLGEVGDEVSVLPTFRCDYGRSVSIGSGTFVNYGAVLLDVAPIAIGEHCHLATNVQLLTATHPVDPVARRAGWESGAPITLGDNVWLGGGVIVCPGVRIGDDTVVGAGAVVTWIPIQASLRGTGRRRPANRLPTRTATVTTAPATTAAIGEIPYSAKVLSAPATAAEA